ncbi:MAG: PEP-CTERM sorting domain-containing protein [Bythopirellula sp.]
MMKPNSLPLSRMLLCTIVLTICTTDVHAVQLDAIQDTWIRESDPTGDYNDDLLSVWDGTTTDQRRYGVVLFDLTATVGVTINSVFLELFDRDDGGNGRSETAPIVQEAYILSATPPLPTGISTPYDWNEYTNFDQSNEVLLDSLGHYNIAAGDTVNGYEVSDFGSAADISLLETTRNNNSNVVAFVFKATSGERDWGDIEFDGTPPRLVINEDPSVLGDFSGNGTVGTEDFEIMTDPLNWLQTVPVDTLGDITGDAFVDLRDFKVFKPIFLAANPSTGGSLAIPEPATLTLFAMVFSGFFEWSRRRCE